MPNTSDNPVMNRKEREHYLFLQQSFEEFNKATVRMQDAFENLEKKFETINRELEEKNALLEQAITEKEEISIYLKHILESLVTGVIVTDLDGRITILNRWAGFFLGLPRGSVIGKRLTLLMPELVEQPAAGRRGRSTAMFPVGTKVRIRGKMIEFFTSPLIEKGSDRIGTIYVLRDVTRIEKLEAMEKRTEKFEAMGELAANIAHEIRNPLGSIELFASLLMKETAQKKSRERLTQIIAAVKTVDNRISNLLLFTRRHNPLMKRINLHRILKEVLVFSRRIIEEGGIELVVCCEPRQPFVHGDPEMLKQVFLNILLNALQAMPDGGHLEVRTRIDDAAVEIRFTDTGRGIAKEDLPRIFNPFFSTRERSSGLGLAIVHTIVDIHEGAVDVDSTTHGTTFTVTLPLVATKSVPCRERGGQTKREVEQVRSDDADETDFDCRR